LGFSEWTPYVRQLTVGSIQIDTASDPGEHVRYMCVETGVGSGNVYYQSDAAASYEEALGIATLRAAKLNEPASKTPERLEQLFVSSVQIKDAVIEQAERNTRKAKRFMAEIRRVVEIEDGEDFVKDEHLRGEIKSLLCVYSDIEEQP
jgi:hypothetical protein